VEKGFNERLTWYSINESILKRIVYLLLAVMAVLVIGSVYSNSKALLKLRFIEWAQLGIFPLVAFLYYGVNSTYSLRKIGWLKPFIIGFSWAGLATIYPAIFYYVENNAIQDYFLVRGLLFLKNFMFVTVLCVMFDIKDYADDFNQQLKTFVVSAGLRRTIFRIIIPLTIFGLASFLGYAFNRQFGTGKILLNIIPFIGVLIVAYSLRVRRSIYYYLIVVDGLMLLKALCGISAMLFF
jgi:hypothetical protein